MNEALVDTKQGWVVVAATFLSTFTVFGVAYSFGAFFGPMAEEFGSSRGATAFFFSVTTFLYFALGVGSGRLADRFGPRPVLLVGGAVMAIGLALTSVVDSLWLGYLTYGIGVGVGVACAYVPMVAGVGLWFERQRTTALGVAVAGIGVGTLVGAPAVEWLVGQRGWRSGYQILAVATAVLLAVAAIGANRFPGATGTTPPSLAPIVRSQPFGVLYVSVGLLTMSLFTPFVFLDDYTDSAGVEGSAGLLVGLIGLFSVLGRLGMGLLATRRSAMKLYSASFFGIAASFGIWLTADARYGQLVLYAVVLGVSYGGFIALSPAVAAEIFGTVGLGGVLGALYTGAGVGGLLGPPMSGALIDSFGYKITLVVNACFAFAGFAVLTRIRIDEPL